MIYQTKAGLFKNLVIKNSPKSFKYLKTRFEICIGYLLVEDEFEILT